MDEYQDLSDSGQHPGASAAKWLTYLFYVHLAGIGVSLFSLLPVGGSLAVWFSMAVALAAVICLFRLAPGYPRYRKAACFRAAMLVVSLIHTVFSLRSPLILVSSLCSILAVYQEYCGHGELVRDSDAGLARKWNQLFIWQIVCSVLISLATTVVSVILALLLNSGENVPATAAIVVQVAAKGTSLVLEAVYLVYLKRTIHLMQTY